jgi:hypothetical protein
MKNKKYLFNVLLFFLYCSFCGCEKTIKINTSIISGLKYIEPKMCEMKKININRYKTEIIDGKLTIDNENLDIFLKNLNKYKLALKEFEACCQINDEYYRNIIKEIIK